MTAVLTKAMGFASKPRMITAHDLVKESIPKGARPLAPVATRGA